MMIQRRMHHLSFFLRVGCFVKVRAKVAYAYKATRAKPKRTVGELAWDQEFARGIQKECD